MTEAAARTRRTRGGGGAARRAERTSVSFDTAKYIERNIPNYEVLSEAALDMIEANAEQILEEVGVNFVNNPAALERWREAGATIEGERVRIPKGLARELCKTAPASFTQHARNPERNVVIGGNTLVCAPVYGPPFVRDAAGGRRYATMDDFQKFVKLGYMSKWLHHSGGTVCEPTDVAVNKRHLDMLLAHMTLSDKPFMGSVTDPSRAQDSVEMCEILFGKEFVQENTVMTSLININSPMTFDDIMMGALEVYAQNNQACIISPFIVGGAMAPVSVAGTLTQVLAELLAGVAYSQLIKPGAPVIAGAFVTSIDMNSGAPTFGTPEASHILYGAGQLARRLGLPFRSGGGLCGSKLPDAQSAYETAHTHNAALLGTRAVGLRAALCLHLRNSWWTRISSVFCIISRVALRWTRTRKRWTRSAKSGRVVTTSGVSIRRKTLKQHSGAQMCSITSRSKHGMTRARATLKRSQVHALSRCSRPINSLHLTQKLQPSFRPMLMTKRPPCRTLLSKV